MEGDSQAPGAICERSHRFEPGCGKTEGSRQCLQGKDFCLISVINMQFHSVEGLDLTSIFSSPGMT